MDKLKTKVAKLNDARRIDREMVIEDKKVNDLIYIKMITESSYDIPQNQMYIDKKKVVYKQWANDLGYKDARTIKTGFTYLIKKGVVKETEKYYIMPIAKTRYFDVSAKTLKKLSNFARADSVRVYLYLIGWYAWCEKNQKGHFQFSLRSINVALGFADDGRARTKTEDILDILQRLGLILISDYTVKVGRGDRWELLYATPQLPEKGYKAFKATKN